MSWVAESYIDRPPGSDEFGLIVRPIFSGSDGGILTVQLASGSLSLALSGSTGEVRPATSTVVNVDYSAAPITLQAANPDRRGWTLFNDANKKLYLKLGSGATTASWTVRLPPNAYYEIPFPAYTGEITGFWDVSGSGVARTTEVTP